MLNLKGLQVKLPGETTENTEKTKDRESFLTFFSVASVYFVNCVLKSSSVAA